MKISFFALPSQQGPVEGCFKPMHLPLSLSTEVPACVRCFEMPISLNHAWTESKKHFHARQGISFIYKPEVKH